ncbi:MAG: C39 family peptidase [bacterium]
MKLNIPFIKNRGLECGQACTAMMIKYFYPNFTPNFEKTNKIIHHQQSKYTFPPQLAILLDHYGVESKVYSSDDIKTTAEDPGQFKRWFGKDYEHEMQYIDTQTVDWMANEIRQKKLFVKKSTKFTDLIELLHQNNLVGFPIDWHTLTGKEGPYEGHFVVISGEEGDNLLIHDPDVGPYQKHPHALVESAWEHSAIADDFILAIGKSRVHS